jgi:lipopolysaccharide biosynthesis regulator YciM
MNRNQISFAFAGLLFGFLVGFVVAHQIYAGRGTTAGFQHPPIPPDMAGRPPAGDRPGAADGSPGGPMSGGAGGPSGGDTATMEQVQKEIQALKELIEKEPRNAMALTRLGDVYFDAGMFDKAKGFYERALAEKPDDVNVRTDLGTVLRNLGQFDAALKEFEAAVAADPKHWKGWFNIGIVCLYDTRDFDRAQKAFERVAELSPGTIDMDALRKEMDRVRSEGGAS